MSTPDGRTNGVNVYGVQDQAALARLFNVSEAAMAIRLRQIGLVDPRPSSWAKLGNELSGDSTIRRYFRIDRTRALDPGLSRGTLELPLLAGVV